MPALRKEPCEAYLPRSRVVPLADLLEIICEFKNFWEVFL
jgi:hypothetical protein